MTMVLEPTQPRVPKHSGTLGTKMEREISLCDRTLQSYNAKHRSVLPEDLVHSLLWHRKPAQLQTALHLTRPLGVGKNGRKQCLQMGNHTKGPDKAANRLKPFDPFVRTEYHQGQRLCPRRTSGWALQVQGRNPIME